MARYEVVIETRETEGGGFRADVAQGPAGVRGFGVWSTDRDGADKTLRERCRKSYPKHKFDFIHALA